MKVVKIAEGRADDLAYIERVGLETIRRHAEDFVREKLGPAEPVNDGNTIVICRPKTEG